MNKRIFIIFGPSTSGKTTLINEMNKINIPRAITTTTRKPRAGEVHGKDYYFVSHKEFDSTEFIEYAEYAGNKYGTSKKEIEDKLNTYDSVCVILEINGVNSFKEKYGDKVVGIYTYCHYETIKQRLIDRGISDDEWHERLASVIDTGELENIDKSDYVIITDKHNLDQCKRQLMFYVSEELKNE